MIKDEYKMVHKETNMKNRFCIYYDNLIKVNNLKIKNVIIHVKNYKDLVFIMLGMFLKNQ